MIDQKSNPNDGGSLDFQAIFTEFQPRIVRYLSKLAGETEAEDLAQEIFIKIEQALPAFRGESKLSTWIYRIATNAALDRMRTPAYRQAMNTISEENKEAELEDRNIWTGEKVPVLEWQVVRKEMAECVQDFIRKIPLNYRLVLLLREFEGLSNQEIATILAISTGAVKIRLHRARERLKQDLIANCPTFWVEGNEYLPDLKNL